MGSNPFVSPNQRGVELPPGCKDLMDVLKIERSERPGAETPVVWYGELSQIEQRVETFLDPGSDTRLLSVGIPKRGFHVMLLKRPEVLALNFSVPAKQQSVKDAAQRIFQNPKFGRNVAGMEYVSIALNSDKDAVARMIVDLLVEGFGCWKGSS